LNVRNGAFVSADTDGIGKAGNLTIKTDKLQITGGGQISASTFGQGNAGDLTITAANVDIDGESPRTSSKFPLASGLFAQVNPNATGKAGNLTLNTKRLNVSNGGRITASTLGNGNGGSLLIKADEINIFDTLGTNPEYLTTITTGVRFNYSQHP
jgi:large exoprotein involved in heme utilization and adhesion